MSACDCLLTKVGTRRVRLADEPQRAGIDAWPEVHSAFTARRRRGFTLLELLVVVAIIAVLVGILAPAMSGARGEATKAKCLANLHALGQAMATYSIDDEKGYTTPVHPKAESSWHYDGEYEYGGKTGVYMFEFGDFAEENRILNRYIYGEAKNVPAKLFQCPSDQGVQPAPVDFEPFFFLAKTRNRPIHASTGTSYRLNNHIDFLNNTEFDGAFYGPYLRPRTRVPAPGQTVLLEEAVAEVAKWNAPNYRTMGWHGKANRFNVSFVDGHAAAIHLAGQSDLSDAYPEYWILREPGWRMDCYPDAPIPDLPRSPR